MNALNNWPERDTPRLAPGEPAWVFGTGNFGRAVARACLAQGFDVQGFVQTQPAAADVDGLPVRTWSELQTADRAMALLVGIFNPAAPYDGLLRLAHEAGCKRILMPWDVYAQFAQELGWRYWLASPEWLRAHAADLNRCHERLADEPSRACLERVVRFRLGLDTDYASFMHPEPRYFNELTLPPLNNRALNYVDGGAYNGDTLLDLIKASPLQQAWLFEPDAANFAKLAPNVRNAGCPASCLPLALSDSYKLLRFSSGQGESSCLDQNGSVAIMAAALDDVLAGQRVDFIKLDIEGAEEWALKGAAQSIAANRPVLAISCYHHPHDLWALPDLLDHLAPAYRYYLRLHAFNSFELVLYAIPDERLQA